MSKMKDQWARINGQYEDFNMYEMTSINKKKKDKEIRNEKNKDKR